MIVIIDYGMGNLRSIQKAFQRLNIKTMISSRIQDIENANKLILPGVGHFANGMQKIKELNLIDVLNNKVLTRKTPVLGICLGMQLFANNSEEGNVNGLRWVDAEVIKFHIEDSLKWKIPHMGWNSIKEKKDNPLLSGINTEDSYYFVHSYHVVCNNKKDILTTTEYNYEFVSAIQHENIYGTQFHPEKSHKKGLKILKNFAELI